MVAGLGNVQLRNQHLALLWQREVFITSFMTNKDFKNNLTVGANKTSTPRFDGVSPRQCIGV